MRTAFQGRSSLSVTFRCAMVAALLFAALTAEAQTFNVLYAFHGGRDGSDPRAGLTMDGRGNLYGTTWRGGVFQLLHRGSGWALNPISEQGGSSARVIFGPDGTLYGTVSNGDGGVFNLRPPPSVCKTVLCPWLETVIYAFQGGNDGSEPYSDPAFDRNGNLYGTTYRGGDNGAGTVFQLSPSNGGWTESIIYNFPAPGPPGNGPASGVVVDNAGNLYGVTNHSPAAYELSPSGSGWGETTIAELDSDPLYSGLTMDASGNFYGTTETVVFELSPAAGGWTYQTLYTFNPNEGPFGTLTMDAAGNLYGASWGGGAHGSGFVFKLSPSQSGWTFTDLHDFTGGSDGGLPMCQLILDGEGNIYGTTEGGGDLLSCFGGGCGVVFEITP